MRTFRTLETLVKDLRHGVRQLRRNPGFTVIAVLALALGIGVNTAVFTAYKTMILRSVDARDPARIVNIALARSSANGNFLFSYPDYIAYRDSVHSLDRVIAFKAEHLRLSGVGADLAEKTAGTGGGTGFLGLPSLPTTNVEYSNVFAISENYLQVLGIRLMAGRGFDSMTAHDLIASPAVLISENYWDGRFSRDPGVLGKTIRLNDVPVTIVGITPRDFVGTSLSTPNLWLPISLEPLVHADENWLHDRENQQLRLYGRLAPGATIGQAQAEVNVLAEHLRSLHDPHSDAAKIRDRAGLVGLAPSAPLEHVSRVDLDNHAHHGCDRDGVRDRLCKRRQLATGARQIAPNRTADATVAGEPAAQGLLGNC